MAQPIQTASPTATASSPLPLARRLESALGLSLRGQLLILAIAAAVCVVTLGQLQAFAVHQNQQDARQLLARLGPALDAALEQPLSERARAELGESKAAALSLAQLAGYSTVRLERFGDVRWLNDGQRMRRHGYQFALQADWDGSLWLVAWPFEHGRTGREAYAYCAHRGLLVHRNPAGALSGAGPIPEPSLSGWQPL